MQQQLDSNKWSEDDLELLQNLWRKGETARLISLALSVPRTRNAVVGMIYRLGLSVPNGRKGLRKTFNPKLKLKPEYVQKPASVVPKPKSTKQELTSIAIGKRGGRGGKFYAEGQTYASDDHEMHKAIKVPHFTPVPIQNLKEGQCKYVLDERGADNLRLYCGGTVHDGYTMCEFHCSRVYNTLAQQPRGIQQAGRLNANCT